MSELSATYSPTAMEERWYAYWMQKGLFHSQPDHREPYSIVIPPPNVTGVLHMGHMLNNTIQDVLVRRARMQGKNACWMPGTDHASIATEAKVVAKLKAQGIDKQSLTRDEFMRHAWEWKEKHGGIILEQLKKLGASCDWDRTCFTMDESRSEAVIDTFIHLYRKGLIYRGVRMVNWDPAGKTAVSDEEVIFKEVKSKFYYVRYYISENGKPGKDFITIATTRPETIMADTGIAINPNDERFFHLHGKKVFVPLIHREIPIILDEYVSIDFGTGCLKVTPAHDINDYELGLKHKLPVIDIIDDEGKLNEKAQILVGVERFEARKQIETLLSEAGHIVRVEDYNGTMGFSERTDVVIEPKLSAQWFLSMKELAKPALEDVMNDTVRLIPEKFKNTYRHWMENVRDWCISRQLWWGQRIPAFYLPDGEVVVAKTAQEALDLCKDKSLTLEDLRQDEDVVDTWFSSWLWPMSTFDPAVCRNGREQANADLKYYYPTSDLVTGPDILFFWVARMIMAGREFMGEVPFRNVYLTGIVRDKQGRKMSKSLGNSPDPLELIANYGADGVRLGMLLCAGAGNDIFFDEAQVEQGRNFCNKIWNAYRLVNGWTVDSSIPQPEYAKVSTVWFESRLNQTLLEVEDCFSKYRISEALMGIYKLYWDEFSAWYLEAIKPAYGAPIDAQTYQTTLGFFDSLLKILHPFMPFITEELWQNMAERESGDSIMIQQMPVAKGVDEQILKDFDAMREAVTGIRNIRKEKNILQREPLKVVVKGSFPMTTASILKKMANLQEFLTYEKELSGSASSFMVGTAEFFVLLDGLLDVSAELEKLQKELSHLQGFLKGVMAKLNNEKFVSGAPEAVVAIEKKKQADAESKIAAITLQIEKLS